MFHLQGVKWELGRAGAKQSLCIEPFQVPSLIPHTVFDPYQVWSLSTEQKYCWVWPKPKRNGNLGLACLPILISPTICTQLWPSPALVLGAGWCIEVPGEQFFVVWVPWAPPYSNLSSSIFFCMKPSRVSGLDMLSLIPILDKKVYGMIWSSEFLNTSWKSQKQWSSFFLKGHVSHGLIS